VSKESTYHYYYYYHPHHHYYHHHYYYYHHHRYPDVFSDVLGSCIAWYVNSIYCHDRPLLIGSVYWAAHQRFFKHLIIAAKIPTVVELVKQAKSGTYRGIDGQLQLLYRAIDCLLIPSPPHPIMHYLLPTSSFSSTFYEENKCVVIGLMSTGEAVLNRYAAPGESNENDLDDDEFSIGVEATLLEVSERKSQ